MPGSTRPAFRGGKNVAMKVPAHHYDATVAFYEDVLGVERLPGYDTPVFAFGPITLWIDRVPHLSQAELWLEVEADDTTAARDWLEQHGVPREDALEPLPADFDGCWVLAPSDIVHLVAAPGQ